MKSYNFNLAYAVERGANHVQNHSECQDRIQIVQTDSYLFMGLCDGAGSVVNSGEGAEFILEELSIEFQNNREIYFTDKNASALLTEFIEKKLERYSIEKKMEFDSLASTLLLVVIHKEQYLIAHVGDGIIIGVTDTNELEVLSEPENGEFSNLTYFLTSISYKKRLRLKMGKTQSLCNGLLICSDGVQELLFNEQSKDIASITKTMIDWLDEYSSNEVSQHLSFNLKKNFMKKSSDDLSLIILKGKQDATI